MDTVYLKLETVSTLKFNTIQVELAIVSRDWSVELKLVRGDNPELRKMKVKLTNLTQRQMYIQLYTNQKPRLIKKSSVSSLESIVFNITAQNHLCRNFKKPI